MVHLILTDDQARFIVKALDGMDAAYQCDAERVWRSGTIGMIDGDRGMLFYRRFLVRADELHRLGQLIWGELHRGERP